MAMAGPTPTPEGRCSSEQREPQEQLAWTCIGLRHSIWVVLVSKGTAPSALKVEASPRGPPRRTFLVRGGGITGMARPGRRAKLRASTFLLTEFRRRGQRPDGDRARVPHRWGRRRPSRDEGAGPSVSSYQKGGGSRWRRTCRRQRWASRHSRGRTVGGMHWHRVSPRQERPGRRRLGAQLLARINAGAVWRQGVREVRWEPLSKASCRAGALLQHPVQAVGHDLRTQQEREVERRSYRN